MNLYKCEVGDVVITGDQYGMSPCVCIESKHRIDNASFEVVTFLNLTNGITHESGGISGYPLDDCVFTEKISLQEVERIKSVWA